MIRRGLIVLSVLLAVEAGCTVVPPTEPDPEPTAEHAAERNP